MAFTLQKFKYDENGKIVFLWGLEEVKQEEYDKQGLKRVVMASGQELQRGDYGFNDVAKHIVKLHEERKDSSRQDEFKRIGEIVEMNKNDRKPLHEQKKEAKGVEELRDTMDSVAAAIRKNAGKRSENENFLNQVEGLLSEEEFAAIKQDPSLLESLKTRVTGETYKTAAKRMNKRFVSQCLLDAIDYGDETISEDHDIENLFEGAEHGMASTILYLSEILRRSKWTIEENEKLKKDNAAHLHQLEQQDRTIQRIGNRLHDKHYTIEPLRFEKDKLRKRVNEWSDQAMFFKHKSECIHREARRWKTEYNELAEILEIALMENEDLESKLAASEENLHRVTCILGDECEKNEEAEGQADYNEAYKKVTERNAELTIRNTKLVEENQQQQKIIRTQGEDLVKYKEQAFELEKRLKQIVNPHDCEKHQFIEWEDGEPVQVVCEECKKVLWRKF